MPRHRSSHTALTTRIRTAFKEHGRTIHGALTQEELFRLVDGDPYLRRAIRSLTYRGKIVRLYVFPEEVPPPMP